MASSKYLQKVGHSLAAFKISKKPLPVSKICEICREWLEWTIFSFYVFEDILSEIQYTSLRAMENDRSWCSFCSIVVNSVRTWCADHPEHHIDDDDDTALYMIGVCNWCFIYSELDEMQAGSIVVNVVKYNIHANGSGSNTPVVVAADGELPEGAVISDDILLELYTTAATGLAPFQAIRHGHHYTESPFAADSIQRVHNWLETCSKGHRFCGRTQKPILPSRLVDVGNDEQAPHLHETTEGDIGDYICLSYRWGTVENMLKTEKSSIAERKRGIPMDILPLTLRDAVQFTRNLGYQYLWIDSLCIIQDDPVDWEKEAAQMGQIYETAILTLSNLQGADASAGCSWNPSCVLTTSINKVSDEGDLYTVFCREVQPPTSCATWAGLKPAGHDDVLFTRGWTLQESLLSPRLLLFTKKQLIWYCNELLQEYKNYGLFADHSLKSTTCKYLQPDRRAKMDRFFKDTLKASIEVASTRWTKDTRMPKFQFNLGQFRMPSMSSIPVMGPLLTAIEFFGVWEGIVSEYTRRHLTQGDDKLAAISAIAKKCSALTEAKYLAGIWFDYYYIRDQLLWKPLPNTTPTLPCVGDCCFKSRYRAPSWSWASVDGEIEGGCTHESMNRSTIFEVLEGDCSTGVDPYGKVTAGFLRARGRVAILSQLGATISWDGRRSRYSLDWNVPIDPSLEESHGASNPPNHAQLTTSEISFLGSPITCPLDSVDEREAPSTLDLASSLYLIPVATDDNDHLRRDGLTNKSVRLVTKHMTSKKHPKKLAVLICALAPGDGRLRSFKRIGRLDVQFYGKLKFLPLYNALSDEEMHLI